jgi:hypothetical protein
MGLKTFRCKKYLEWLRDQPCITCKKIPSWGDGNTASHIGVSNFGIKPPDNQCVPQCPNCHWLYEYHKDKFKELTKKDLPTLEDCERYFTFYKLGDRQSESE